jgi:ribosomal protein L7/L12
MADTIKKETVRIEFAIGSQEDGRWTTFGGDVPTRGIAEWFRFTGEALAKMWNTGTYTASVTIEIPGPNKINTIKEVRNVTGCGLKEAKDAVEMQYGGIVAVFEDCTAAERFKARLESIGNKIRLDRFTGDRARFDHLWVPVLSPGDLTPQF